MASPREVDRRRVVLDAIEHRETPVCPYTFEMEHDSDVGPALDCYYGSDRWREWYANFILRLPPIDDGRHVWEPGDAYRRDHFGSRWRVDLKPVHLETPALDSPRLTGYRFPSVDRFVTESWDADVQAALRREPGRFTVLYPGFGLFERSWTMRGFENALADAAAEPAFYGELVTAICEEHMEPLLDRLLTYPVDGILFGDDWGDQRGVMIGPERWRELFKPLYARLYRKVHAAGKVALNHVCGSIVDILPDVVDIGLDVLESVQPEARGMDPYALKSEFGDALTFWGGLGSQTVIPFGTPEEVRSEIRRLAKTMSEGGGYILSCAKALQKGTPTENAAAILEEFIRAGEPKA